MSMSDTLGDMLTRIRNGQTTNKKVVDAPASRFRKNVLEVLKREGFIRNYEEKELPHPIVQNIIFLWIIFLTFKQYLIPVIFLLIVAIVILMRKKFYFKI